MTGDSFGGRLFERGVKRRRYRERRYDLKILLGISLILLGIAGFFFADWKRDRGTAVLEQLKEERIFLKQEEKSSCTLCAAAMMLRREALLREDLSWESVTERKLKKYAWMEGQGLRHDFTFQNSGKNYQVAHGLLPGGEENREILISLLEEHPEGIVLYHGPGEKQHAVLLTDVTDGTFFCADPCEEKPKGRILLEQAAYVTVENANAYWYVVLSHGA